MGIRTFMRDLVMARPEEERQELPYSWNQFIADYNSSFIYNGYRYGGTLRGTTESIDDSFDGLIQGAVQSNGVVFGCMLARLSVFSDVRFTFRELRNGTPGDLVGNPDGRNPASAGLRLLQNPWAGGTTGDLLARMIQDADVAGNAFVARRAGHLFRMRPDWVTIVASTPGNASLWHPDAEVEGYIYKPGGAATDEDPIVFLREEVAHFAPVPDPAQRFRGMSWLWPVVSEILADKAMTSHKQRFFENGATVNMVVEYDSTKLPPAAFQEAVKEFQSRHEGEANAYKTLHLFGATAKAVGSNMEQIDFKVVQGHGEPLALDTPVPTPTGWTTMGEITPGSQVVGSDGLPANVLDVGPIHTGRKCYRVAFNDGTSIVADEGHLWAAMDRATSTRAEKTYTTAELLAGMEAWKQPQSRRYAVRPVAPMKGEAQDFLLDPYVLGAWLGDGQTAGAAICGATEDLAVITSEIEARGYTTTQWNTSETKVDVIGLPGGVLAALDAIGVLGNKHIPAEYLRASFEQRLDLLRGLMDTDGTADKHGSCEFSSKYEHLARQAAELVRSFGMRCTVSRKEDPRSRTGETWRVTFHADPEMVPFNLPRKAARCMKPMHVRNRAIVSIEPVESVPVRCITVDTADHLFAAGEGWMLTHNTRIAAAAGVPPIIVGLSEGLEAATYSNYGQARRAFADRTIRPLWRNACGSLSQIISAAPNTELWYDDTDVAFLREDQKDAADIRQVDAQSIKALAEAGYEPDSVVDAVTSGDMKRLQHSGMFSVQLQPPGSKKPKPPLPGQSQMPMDGQDMPDPEDQQQENAIALADAQFRASQAEARLEWLAKSIEHQQRKADPISQEIHIHNQQPEVKNDVRVERQELSISTPPVHVEPHFDITTPDVHVDSPVTVESPEIHVDVAPTEVRVDVAAPDPTPLEVNVAAPEVTVGSPEVRVEVEPTPINIDIPVQEPPTVNVDVAVPDQPAPQVNITMPKTRRKVIRDEQGKVTHMEEEVDPDEKEPRG